MAVTQTVYAQTKRIRCTTAQINATTGAELLPALNGYAYRLIDAVLIAYGGAAATATSVDIIGTRSAATVRPLVAAVAAIAQSVVAHMGVSNLVVLADGASFSPLDAGTAVVLGTQAFPSAGNLATATGIDVILTYAVEPA
jgi:hypothetical protein